MIRRILFIQIVSLGLLPSLRAAEKWTLDSGVREKCLGILREEIQSDDFWPAMHAAEALTLAGLGSEVIDRLGPKLDTEKDDQRRCGLARELVRAGDRSKSSVMMEILRGDDPHGHVHAAESLYKVGWDGSPEPLQEAFGETENVLLKIMAAAALAKFVEGDRGENALSFLRDHLATESDPGIFRISAWVLGRIGTDRDRGLIRSRLDDTDDPLVRAFLEHALAALGDSDGKAALRRNLKSDDSALRTYAAVFAGETGMTETAPDLIPLLDDENLDVRIRAAQALLTLAP
ncbi:MAG: HEAT repeat domain-containing protein [Verrucomicrobiales bacterium]